MIKYQLVCESKHEFEGWFQTGAAFDNQNQDGLITCPVCDSGNVRRALMTPNLVSSKGRSVSSEISVPSSTEVNPVNSTQEPSGKAQVPATNFASSSPTLTAAAVGEAMSKLRELQRRIKTECRDVGHNFAQEARKIHYGESVSENIYGQSTEEERDALADEGIDVLAMPWLPPEH